MAYTTVTCACGAEVTPGLLHYEGGILRNRLTEHVCPVCGVVMYTTGGGFREFVKPVFARLVPSLLFLYAYFCAKTGYWANAAILGTIASCILYYSFPALTRKLGRIGVGIILPLVFLWIAVRFLIGGGVIFALISLIFASTLAFFSHRKFAHQLIRRFHPLFRGAT